MNDKYIEMVCTGNHGRSPIAELVAQNYLKKIGAQNYLARSSGILVGIEPDLDMKLKILDVARMRNLYTKNELSTIDNAITNGKSDVLTQFFNAAVKKFSDEEHGYREEAIKRFNITGSLKITPEKTIERYDNLAVLTMDENQKIRVMDIYSNGSSPIISTLGLVATGSNENIANAFGKTQKDFDKSVEMIVAYVPLAVETLVRDF